MADNQAAPPPPDAEANAEATTTTTTAVEDSQPDIAIAPSAETHSFETVSSSESLAAVTTTTAPGAPPPNVYHATDENAPTFPCIEQPLRVTLHCNGYYLWGLRKGRVIARKRRSEKDEFRLEYPSAEDRSIVKIHNYKFGGTLTVFTDPKDGLKKLVCVKKDKGTTVAATASSGMDDSSSKRRASLETKEETEALAAAASGEGGTESAAATSTGSERFTDEYVAEEEDKPALESTDTIMEEDQKWCFIRGTGHNQVILKSLSTGENLAVDAKGQIVFCTDDMNNSNKDVTSSSASMSMTWDVECSTGELCFIANPSLNRRLRCDMAGLITLTDSWKGWEVFRFMEASHGYVKISSWMHSQWLLCSRADGRVTTCLMAESFLDDDDPDACSKWAIEKAPEDGSTSATRHGGVIIRSKTFGSLLCVEDGQLKMIQEGDDITVNSIREAENSLRQQELDKANANATEGGNKWSNWRKSVTSMNTSMRNSVTTMQKRLSQSNISGSSALADVPVKETTVWQLEAAHSQTYYFGANLIEGEKPKTIGPFPYVTPNLRQTDKIQLVREPDETTKLYIAEKQQYIACSGSGEIVFLEDATDKRTEWIMDKPSLQDGGSVFRSKLRNLYLSYQDLGEAAAAAAAAAEGGKKGSHFNFFLGRQVGRDAETSWCGGDGSERSVAFRAMYATSGELGENGDLCHRDRYRSGHYDCHAICLGGCGCSHGRFRS